MANSQSVFLDANVLVYALDATSQQHEAAVLLVQEQVTLGSTLCTSHHVIEEVLHIAKKIQPDDITLHEVIKQIKKIPNLVLIEPSATIEFAELYAKLGDRLNMDVNDALLLQLMLDANITYLFSYDKKFVNKAVAAGVASLTL